MEGFIERRDVGIRWGVEKAEQPDEALALSQLYHQNHVGVSASVNSQKDVVLEVNPPYGTWTPTMIGSDVEGPMMGGTSGHYLMLGNLIWLEFHLSFGTPNGAEGDLIMTDIPADLYGFAVGGQYIILDTNIRSAIPLEIGSELVSNLFLVSDTNGTDNTWKFRIGSYINGPFVTVEDVCDPPTVSGLIFGSIWARRSP